MRPALAAAHAQGVLHCDVKPVNIVLTAYGHPALSDFGIARMTLESQGSRIGGYTLDHVPPEVLAGANPTDRGDVWSLATTVWQLIESRPPFREGGDVAAASVMRRIENEPIPRMRRRDVPDDLTGLLERMTAKDPQRRPSAEVSRRAGDLARTLGHPVGAPLPLPPRRSVMARTGSPSVPPAAVARSTLVPPAPRAPRPEEDDAATGRIPLTRSAPRHSPAPTAHGRPADDLPAGPVAARAATPSLAPDGVRARRAGRGRDSRRWPADLPLRPDPRRHHAPDRRHRHRSSRARRAVRVPLGGAVLQAAPAISGLPPLIKKMSGE